MNKKTKRLLTLIFSLVLVTSMAVQSLSAAAVDPITQIEPQWLHTSSVTLEIEFTDTQVIATAVSMGLSGTTYQDVSLTLQKASGDDKGVLGEWKNISSSSSNLVLIKYVNFTPSDGTYRLSLKATTLRNGETGIINQVRDVRYPG